MNRLRLVWVGWAWPLFDRDYFPFHPAYRFFTVGPLELRIYNQPWGWL